MVFKYAHCVGFDGFQGGYHFTGNAEDIFAQFFGGGGRGQGGLGGKS